MILRTWMGHSVGRREGDTFVVDRFGFNERTWLDRRGLPHPGALRMTERYQRHNVGQLHVEVTVTDPGAFTGRGRAVNGGACHQRRFTFPRIA